MTTHREHVREVQCGNALLTGTVAIAQIGLVLDEQGTQHDHELSAQQRVTLGVVDRELEEVRHLVEYHPREHVTVLDGTAQLRELRLGDCRELCGGQVERNVVLVLREYLEEEELEGLEQRRGRVLSLHVLHVAPDLCTDE